MKRIRPLALLLALIMLIGVGCTDTTTPGDDVDDTNTEATTPENTNATEPDVTVEATPDVPADRYDATVTPRTGNNATSPLVISISELDRKFSSFFYTSAYDNEVIEYTTLYLLYFNKDTEPRAGVEYPCLAYDYETEFAADGSYANYKFYLKNGITFSDGTPVTMKDVLFSIYVLCDQYYDGSTTFYTNPIIGMEEYRMQASAEMIDVTAAIMAAGISEDEEGNMLIPTVDGATAEQAEAFWSYLNEGGAKFAQDIIDIGIIADGYLEDKYVDAYFVEGMTAAEINTDELLVAFSMAMWGFADSYDPATNVLTDIFGTEYTLGNGDVTAETFWNVILADYGYDLEGINHEAAGDEEIQDYVRSAYLANVGGSSAPTSIAGITTGREVCEDGVERDYILFECNQTDPSTIFRFALPVNPWHYYTAGYNGTLNENGVDIANRDFMDHLKKKNEAPMGAGPYIFDKFEDNVVYFEANDSFLLGSPKIKYVRRQVISSGGQMDAVRTETVHFTQPGATAETVTEISAGEGDNAKLAYTLVDNDGYGYICMNGQAIPEWDIRKALAHSIDHELFLDHYGELATINYRPMTKVQWAYPENPENRFPYDGTGETSKALFLGEGYIYDEAANVMYYPEGHEKAGQQVTFKATLPYEAADHPAGSVFLNMQVVLETIGVKFDIEVDPNVLSKTSTAFESGLQIVAAAWGNGGADPDMFQVWHSDNTINQGTSPNTKGLYYLYENGSPDQQEALKKLNTLIMAGRTTMDVEQRKVIYAQALEIAADMACEIPTYQRKNMYVYNKEYINASSLFSGEDVTPWQSPVSYIWNVELN